GTAATQCLHLPSDPLSAEIAIKGLAKMRDLRYIRIWVSNKCDITDKVSKYLPSSLRYMTCHGFPFSSLPNTFQGKHLVVLELYYSKIVQLWEDGEGKVLNNLRFFSISWSKLRTFDLRATRDQATQQFMFIHHSRIKSAFPFKEDATMMPPNRRKEKERISYGLRISTEMIDEGKTEDPHEDVEKLEKEGDKTMNDQNARRLRMHVKIVKIFPQANQKP
nr:Toll/interleukin-1 receptor (TIR) domain-containing protein [Tanacetum cinerariifolium]